MGIPYFHKNTKPWMRRNLNALIKLAIAAIFLAIVGYQLLVEKDISAMWKSFVARWNEVGHWPVVLACLVMPIGWILEAKKWQELMRPALTLKFGQSLKAVLGGVSISLFTPNRIGEYGGRILFVPSRYNWRTVIATLVGSFAQNIVHVALGLMALLAFLLFLPDLPDFFHKGIAVLAVIILVLCTAIYYNVGAISSWASRIEPARWLRKPWMALQHLGRIRQSVLTHALVYSLLKYLVFTTQFVLLLRYFGVEVPITWIYAGVAVMYLMQTSIPLPPFMDVVARSELAILLWAAFEVSELAVFAASFFIWVLNLLIPAFVGLIAIGSVNVLQALGYEAESTTQDIVSSGDRIVDGRTA